MTNIIQEFEKMQIASALENKNYPAFREGDTVKIEYSFAAGGSDEVERVQFFEGLCIKKRNRGFSSSFLLRKLSYHGIYVEKHFLTYSPAIKSIVVLKRGVVRRAKLYYIRKLSGKGSRIREKAFNATQKVLGN